MTIIAGDVPLKVKVTCYRNETAVPLDYEIIKQRHNEYYLLMFGHMRISMGDKS